MDAEAWCVAQSVDSIDLHRLNNNWNQAELEASWIRFVEIEMKGSSRTERHVGMPPSGGFSARQPAASWTK